MPGFGKVHAYKSWSPVLISIKPGQILARVCVVLITKFARENVLRGRANFGIRTLALHASSSHGSSTELRDALRAGEEADQIAVDIDLCFPLCATRFGGLVLAVARRASEDGPLFVVFAPGAGCSQRKRRVRPCSCCRRRLFTANRGYSLRIAGACRPRLRRDRIGDVKVTTALEEYSA